MIGDFQDKATKLKFEKEKGKKRKIQKNSNIHWIDYKKVLKAQCCVCRHGSSTIYQCFQCQVNIHPECMAIYHEWI